MKPHMHTTDMDFRVIPSAIPLQSPSPDKKNANNITPTVSPCPIEIKKNITPHKRNRTEKENSKYNPDHSTDMKYATHSPSIDYSSALNEKQQVIRNLKRIIDLITQNGRKNISDDGQQNDLRRQIKILTIENQKLVNIVQKMSKNKDQKPQQSTKIQQHYERQISQLIQTIKITKQQHEDEQKQLKRLYKALNIHCKNVQNQKKQLQMQNEKLLKILKDRTETQKKINEKSRVSENSEIDSEKSHNYKNEKLTLTKIKQQYNENMKMLREGLVKEIQQTFDTMRIALQGLGSKVTHLTSRLQSIQKVIWQQIRNRQQIDEPTLLKNKKSQIYIEEGPDSSHPSHQTSKDEGADISQCSSNQLRDQLAKTKTQLQQLRFKYDKMCLDTSHISYSKRTPLQANQQYEQILLEVGKKDKEIEILYSQIKNIQEQNLQVSRQKYSQWQQIMQRTVNQLKQNHYQQVEKIKGETEVKVKLLVENYDKEIQLLRNQIILKNTDLHEAKELGKMTKSQSQKHIENLQQRIHELTANISLLNSKLQISESKLQQMQIEAEMNEQNWQREKKISEQKYLQIENIGKTDRTKRQEIEQQLILNMVQVNQYKRQCEQTKELMARKCQQLTKEHEQKIEQLQERHKKQKQGYQEQKQNSARVINEMKLVLQEYGRQNILDQINQMYKYTQQQTDRYKSQDLQQQSQHKYDKLQQQINELRQCLLEQQQKCITKQARIIELQGLCELNRTKFEEQQAMHLQLLSKYKEIQNKNVQILQKMKDNSYEGVLDKLLKIKSLEEERIRQINTILKK